MGLVVRSVRYGAPVMPQRLCRQRLLQSFAQAGGGSRMLGCREQASPQGAIDDLSLVA